MHVLTRNTKGLAAMVAVGTLALTACSGGGSVRGGASAPTQSVAQSGDADCSAYKEYGKHPGTQVSLFSSIRQIEADQLQQTFDTFTKCTGITVKHNGVGEFEQQIVVQVEGNNAPDLAIFPQPGLFRRMVATGKVVKPPSEVEKNVDKGWDPSWKELGTVKGTFYAAPLMASVKSFVWYSPKTFKEHGYQIPQTWDEMMALTKKIAEDTKGQQGVKPWCAGIESGDATGWPATDWIKDAVLRSAGPDVYDQWVKHEIPFNDPHILKAANMVGDILRNDAYVNGGIGDARSVASTSFNDAGLPILQNKCYMHRQASFYEAQWPKGTKISKDGDIYAFYMPSLTTDTKPIVVGGEVVGAFSDRPEVKAVQEFMSSSLWANIRVKIGGVTSANKGVDSANASSDILRESIKLLQDKNAIARFDASDNMPSEVAGAFWKGMTQWINGEKDIKTVLNDVENSWKALDAKK